MAPRNNSNPAETHEKSSCASTRDILQKHIDLDWKVNFQTSQLSGSASIVFDVINAVNFVDLDTRQLDIQKVENLSDPKNQPSFTVSDANLIKESITSSKLHIEFPTALEAKSRVVVKIFYATSASASGLQWLNKEQTKDKVEPYLFSQCQAIHCRRVVKFWRQFGYIFWSGYHFLQKFYSQNSKIAPQKNFTTLRKLDLSSLAKTFPKPKSPITRLCKQKMLDKLA